MINNGVRNVAEYGEVMQLLEHLQQRRQAQSRSLATSRPTGPFELVRQRCVAGLQLPRRQDFGKARIGGAFDGGMRILGIAAGRTG